MKTEAEVERESCDINGIITSAVSGPESQLGVAAAFFDHRHSVTRCVFSLSHITATAVVRT